MKNKIQNLIKEKPKHYTRLIKKDPKLYQWVMNNSTSASEFLPTHIYSALSGESNICVHGGKREYDRGRKAFKMCGTKTTCRCYSEQLSKSVTEAKQKITKEEQEEINQKRKETMIEKYGVGFNLQRNDVIEKLKSPKVHPDALKKLDDKDWLHEEYVVKKRSSLDIGNDLNCYYGTVISYCKKHDFEIKRRSNYSIIEKQVIDFIQSLGVTAIHSDWDTLENKELDILIPSHNLAIEIDGLYWHSFNPNSQKVDNRFRHLEKTVECQSKGIQLLHITDGEWNTKKDIISAIIESKLGMNQTLHARKLKIVEISPKDAKNFFTQYHLQGHVPSKYYFGLELDGDIVMAISAGRHRFTKNSDFIELYRLCSKRGISIAGGASKLIKHLQKISDSDIITYCDRSKSSGEVYKTIGFKYVRENAPGYFWTDGTEVVSRYMAQKHRLKTWLPEFQDHLTEDQNMFNAKYRKFWDCGNYVFEMRK